MSDMTYKEFVARKRKIEEYREERMLELIRNAYKIGSSFKWYEHIATIKSIKYRPKEPQTFSNLLLIVECEDTSEVALPFICDEGDWLCFSHEPTSMDEDTVRSKYHEIFYLYDQEIRNLEREALK